MTTFAVRGMLTVLQFRSSVTAEDLPDGISLLVTRDIFNVEV